ncbi:vascular endothelial growth factor B isoform X3 [Microcebus murinus]|uniref:vascular endothelial growth factor B isoform X3 n=1 Tax=Microcebus murinus TaxID=30608 RepID=UPI003F6A64BA
MRPLLRRLLLAALLQLAPAQAPLSQPDAPGHQKKVVSWIDVYARATCQPREVVVPLTVELMGTVAKQLVPSCVTVQRCGGCCPDDGLECVPTGQHQVRMQTKKKRQCCEARQVSVFTPAEEGTGCTTPGPSAHAAPSAASVLTPGPAAAAADAAASSVARGGA